MKAKILTLLIALPLLFTACTDLDEKYYSQIDPDKVPSESKVRDVYASLKGNRNSNPMTLPFWKYVYAIQTSTDEICIPRQESNAWFDGGIYNDMQSHHWKADNIIFNSAWEYLYKIIANCNDLLLRYKEEFSYADRAELQTLRAYAYYRLMDLFGNVPLKTEANYGELQYPEKMPRAELFAWIENQLTYIEGTTEKVSDHLSHRTLANYGTMTQGAYNVLKARLYLNSKVFLGLTDDSSEYQAYLQKAIDACDEIISFGDYRLESNVFANWYLNNGARSREIIFAIPYIGNGSGEGNELQIETLMPSTEKVFRGSHYASSTSGWQVNPGKTADDPNALVNIFHPNDNRRLAILSGALYDRDKYVEQKKLDGTEKFEQLQFANWGATDALNPFGTSNEIPGRPAARQPIYVNLTSWFHNRGFGPDVSDCSYKAFGARIIKFELEENPAFYESPVDMVVMRYAEVLYTKAEALIRLGRGGDAVPLFREVLQHRGFDPLSSANYTKDYPFRDMDTDIYGNAKPSDAADGKKISAVALMSKRWLTGRTTDLTIDMPIIPDLEFMDKEWRREFIFEDRRRTDMIRMGKFITESWGMHEASNDANLNIFPIPQTIVSNNPKVLQNPGYLP